MLSRHAVTCLALALPVSAMVLACSHSAAPRQTSQAGPVQPSAFSAQQGAPSEGASPTAGWHRNVCHESRVLQAVGNNVVDRDGGVVIARMAPLVAARQNKVLWRPTNGYRAATLRLTAERLDGPAQAQDWSLAHATTGRDGSEDGGYPSNVDVPAPGCWRLTAYVGSVRGVVIVAVAPQ